MLGKLAICNVAVTRLGQTQITSLSEDDKKARLCLVFWDLLRDALLQEQWWTFATKRQTLALLTETPDSEFDYYYQIPTDCITPRYLVDGKLINYRIEGDKLATDYDDDVELVYTFRETDPTKFSPHFADLLAYRLALELTIPLKSDLATRDRVEQDYIMAQRKYSVIDKRRGNTSDTSKTGWANAGRGAIV